MSKIPLLCGNLSPVSFIDWEYALYIELCKASCMGEVGKRGPCQAICRRNPKGLEVQLLHDPLQAPYVWLIDLFYGAIFNPNCPTHPPHPQPAPARAPPATRRVSRRLQQWFPLRGKNHLQKLAKKRRKLRKPRSRPRLCCIHLYTLAALLAVD